MRHDVTLCPWCGWVLLMCGVVLLGVAWCGVEGDRDSSCDVVRCEAGCGVASCDMTRCETGYYMDLYG